MCCSTFNLLIGPTHDAGCGRICLIILWIFSTFVTLLTRIIFLVFCIINSNSIVVTLYPPSDISLNNNCSGITVVTGSLSYNLYEEPYNKTELFYYENNLLKSFIYDEYSYYKHYFYCGDITKYLDTQWIPVLTWFILIILPQFLLSTIVFAIKFKSKSFKILLLYPGFTLTSILSHHNIGPLSWSQDSRSLIHSKLLSYINILMTFLGMCFIIHLITAGFGAGDGRHLRYVLPLVTCVPLFLFSWIFAMVFIHLGGGCCNCCGCNCCTRSQRSVFNPEDPGKLYILGPGDSVIEENNFEMNK